MSPLEIIALGIIVLAGVAAVFVAAPNVRDPRIGLGGRIANFLVLVLLLATAATITYYVFWPPTP